MSVKAPAWSRRVACACGHVYAREPSGVRLERIDTTVQPPVRGPGTELHKILGCGCCGDWVAQMNQWGPDVCLERIDTIIQWMQEDGEKRNSPISEESARRMIVLAVERAREVTQS